jgi:multicomponent Na+:H+ antiporter subunit D
MALLLSASWMLGSDQFQFLDNITSLIIVALLLLTASFPFQIWVAPVVRESSSLVPAVVFGIGHLLIVAFGLDLLLAQPFVYGSAQFQNLVSASAAATLILGGLLAITARSFGHLLGYLLLISIGAVSAVLASGGAAIVPVAMTLLILRIISLTAAGAGLAMIRSQALTVAGGANQFAANRGLVWRTPLGLGLFVLGGLSVIGLPLTPGFAGTWPAVLLIAQRSPWLAAILVLAIAAGALGVFRRLIPLLSRPEVASDPAERPTEDRLSEIVAAILLVLGALLTLFPQFASTFGESLAALF